MQTTTLPEFAELKLQEETNFFVVFQTMKNKQKKKKRYHQTRIILGAWRRITCENDQYSKLLRRIQIFQLHLFKRCKESIVVSFLLTLRNPSFSNNK